MGKSVQNKPIDRKKKEENAPSEKNVIPGLNAERGTKNVTLLYQLNFSFANQAKFAVTSELVTRSSVAALVILKASGSNLISMHV